MQDIYSLLLVNNRFKEIAGNDKIWRPLYEKEFAGVYIDEGSSNFKRLYALEVLDGRSLGSPLFAKQRNCCFGGGGPNPLDMKISQAHSPMERLRQGAKLTILGDVATGKTSILLRFVRNSFSESHEATIGASFLTKQLVVENTPVKLEIWDTAGAERYHSLAPMYYRGSVAALIVYDVTHQESIERALKWVDEIEKSVHPRPVIALVGNKVDKAGRQITTAQGKQHAAELDVLFWETSAKSGLHIQNLFVGIAKGLIARAREQSEV